MKIELAKATEKDIELILDLMKSYYHYEELPFDRDSSRNAIAGLISKDALGFINLINVDGKTIGYICITYGYSLEYLGRDCIIDELYIIPEYQKQGIGSRVLSQVEKNLYDLGIKAIHLEVFNKNESGFTFFRKNGFITHKSRFMSKKLGR